MSTFVTAHSDPGQAFLSTPASNSLPPGPGGSRSPLASTNARGQVAEAVVLGALFKAGKRVLVLWGEQRYDLVIDDGGRFLRVQVKAGWLKRGAVCFNTASLAYHIGGGARAYGGDVDLFAVYCPQTGKVYLVPIDHVPTGRQASLRVEQSGNGQVKGIRWASPYELA